MARILEAGRNRASPDEAASFVEEYDRLEQVAEVKLAELDADFKQKKRAVKKEIVEEQRAILADAKKQGVKKGVIRALADGRKKIRAAGEAKEKAQARAEELIDALEDDDRDFAVDIREALGDFADSPLGAAAVDREEEDKTSEIVEAVQEAWSGEDKDEWDEAAPETEIEE